jgi:hypothetical protein
VRHVHRRVTFLANIGSERRELEIQLDTSRKEVLWVGQDEENGKVVILWPRTTVPASRTTSSTRAFARTA